MKRGLVTLIRPPVVLHVTNFAQTVAAPPLALACLAAVLKRAGYRVKIIDAVGEKMDQFVPIPGTPFRANGLDTEEIIAQVPEDSDFIGVSCMFSNEWLSHRHVINALTARFPGKPLVVGGEHATAAPGYVLRSCPGVLACVMGEGDDTLLDLLDALASGRPLDQIEGIFFRNPANGSFVRTNPRERMKHLDDLPWPDWDEAPLENYLAAGAGYGIARGRNMPMLASRGCPYKCAFCSNPQMWGRRWNVRSAQDVVAEIKHWKQKYRIDSVSFYDLTTVIRRDWILEFTNMLIAENLGVTWQMPSGTRSEALDPEVVANLKRAGCGDLVYAPESGSKETLERVHKKVNLEKMLVSMRACAREGVLSKAHIILGFPGESVRDMLKSIRFIVKMACVGVNDVAVYPFVPYPGSEFHEQLRREGKFPPEGEAYDLFLAQNCNNNFVGVRSYNEYLGDRQLRLACSLSMVFFYILMYSIRPWRLFGSVFRIATSRPLTLAERIFDTFVWRNKTILCNRLRSLWHWARPATSGAVRP